MLTLACRVFCVWCFLSFMGPLCACTCMFVCVCVCKTTTTTTTAPGQHATARGFLISNNTVFLRVACTTNQKAARGLFRSRQTILKSYRQSVLCIACIPVGAGPRADRSVITRGRALFGNARNTIIRSQAICITLRMCYRSALVAVVTLCINFDKFLTVFFLSPFPLSRSPSNFSLRTKRTFHLRCFHY